MTAIETPVASQARLHSSQEPDIFSAHHTCRKAYPDKVTRPTQARTQRILCDQAFSEENMTKTPSPCIDVCKFKRKGHCIGCSMTKAQKSLFKQLKKDKHRRAFVDMLVAQQAQLGKYTHWPKSYMQKCAKKKVTPVKAVRDAA